MKKMLISDSSAIRGKPRPRRARRWFTMTFVKVQRFSSATGKREWIIWPARLVGKDEVYACPECGEAISLHRGPVPHGEHMPGSVSVFTCALGEKFGKRQAI